MHIRITKGRGGRPRKVYDPETAKKVMLAASLGHSHIAIAKAVGVCDKTLRKLYRRELERGDFEALLQVEAALYKKAISGNVRAQIYLLHAKAGWVDPHSVRHPKKRPRPAPDGHRRLPRTTSVNRIA